MAPKRTALDVSWATLWRVFFFLVIVTFVVLGRRILLGLFLAIVISSGLEFLVTFLERRGLPRPLGVILIFLSAAVIVILTVYALVPLIIVDLHNAVDKLDRLGAKSFLGPLLSPKATQSLSTFVNNMTARFLSGGTSPLGAFSDIVGSFALAVSVLVSSFYLSLSRGGVDRFLRAVMPEADEEAALRIYESAIRKIGNWFRSQLLLSFIMGTLVLAILLLLGVKYAFLIALLTAMFELMPIIGPIISGSIAALAALATSPQIAFYTLIAFVFIHQLESHVLVPLLVGRGVGLHPVVVIIALLLGAEIGGFLGIIISVPLAVVFQEIVADHSDQKKRMRREATA